MDAAAEEANEGEPSIRQPSQPVRRHSSRAARVLEQFGLNQHVGIVKSYDNSASRYVVAREAEKETGTRPTAGPS